MCLHDIPMFKRQLRAIMRASVLGDVRIMFPMISTLMELRQAKMVLNDVMEELEDEGIPFRRDIPIGMMIEVPSAAHHGQPVRQGSELLLDRDQRPDPVHAGGRPDQREGGRAVLPGPPGGAGADPRRDPRRAREISISVSVCGEMAGDPLYTLLLLGLGLNIVQHERPGRPGGEEDHPLDDAWSTRGRSRAG